MIFSFENVNVLDQKIQFAASDRIANIANENLKYRYSFLFTLDNLDLHNLENFDMVSFVFRNILFVSPLFDLDAIDDTNLKVVLKTRWNHDWTI